MKFYINKYFSSKFIIFLPLIVLVFNQSLVYFYGIEKIGINPIANIFHFFGGLSIVLSSVGIMSHLHNKNLININCFFIFYCMMIGALCFSIIMWEIYEFVFVYPYYPEYLGYEDTIIDMILGFSGGFFGTIIVIFTNRQ